MTRHRGADVDAHLPRTDGRVPGVGERLALEEEALEVGEAREGNAGPVHEVQEEQVRPYQQPTNQPTPPFSTARK